MLEGFSYDRNVGKDKEERKILNRNDSWSGAPDLRVDHFKVEIADDRET